MKAKYQADLEGVGADCPPKDYAAGEIAHVYRWVFDRIDDPRNFIPPFQRNPPRFLNSTQQVRCESMALSMFDNLEGAKLRFGELKQAMGPSIYKTLGTKIAVGSLGETDGVWGDKGKHGHFNLHPSVAANFKDKFQISTEAL